MLIYWFFFTVLLIIGTGEVLLDRNHIITKPAKIVIVLLLVPLIVFAGGRLNTGLDYFGYLRYFNESQSGRLDIINRIVEPGYVLLNKLMPTYRSLLFLLAIVCIGIKARTFVTLKVKYPFFIIFVYYSTYFLFYDMGVMRQGLAIGICLYSIRFIKEKKLNGFLICILVAASLHISSVAFLVMYPLGKKRLKMSQYFTIITICVFVILADINLVNVIGAVSNMFHSELILNRLEYYYIPHSGNSLKGTAIKRGLMGLLFVALLCKKRNTNVICQTFDEREYCEDRWIFLNGYTFSMVALAGMYVIGLHNIAGRFSAGLYANCWFLYDCILYTTRKKAIHYICLILFIALSTYSFYETLYFSADNSYIQYLFFIGD